MYLNYKPVGGLLCSSATRMKWLKCQDGTIGLLVELSLGCTTHEEKEVLQTQNKMSVALRSYNKIQRRLYCRRDYIYISSNRNDDRYSS